MLIFQKINYGFFQMQSWTSPFQNFTKFSIDWDNQRFFQRRQILTLYPTYRHILTHLQQFLLLPQCFQLFSVIIPTIIDIIHFFSRHFQNRLLQNCCMWASVNQKRYQKNVSSHQFTNSNNVNSTTVTKTTVLKRFLQNCIFF